MCHLQFVSDRFHGHGTRQVAQKCATCRPLSVLKQDLRRELPLPRGEGRSDAAKRRAADVAVRRLEIGLVEQMERLGPELQARAFAPESELLVQTEVELISGYPTTLFRPAFPQGWLGSVGAETQVRLR